MKRSIWSALLLGLLCACSGNRLPTPIAVESVVDFREALENAGVEVRQVESHLSDLPEAKVQSWEVSGEPIYIYSISEGFDSDQILAQLTAFETEVAEEGQQLQVWQRDSFVVVYTGVDGGVVLLISGLLGDSITRQVSGPDEPYPPSVSAAQDMLADELGVSPSEVRVVNYVDVLWPDSCLGLAEQDEVCAEVETPGWRIELSTEGVDFVLHTDMLGEQIKRAR
jgi:hypothetical protein